MKHPRAFRGVLVLDDRAPGRLPQAFDPRADPLPRGCGQTISCAPKIPHRPLFFQFVSQRAPVFNENFMPEAPLA